MARRPPQVGDNKGWRPAEASSLSASETLPEVLLCLVGLLSPRERVQVAAWLLVVGYQSSRIVRFFDHAA
ncbi:MAG: hypothetical protein E8A12_18335 [Phenylobacterium sp.]|nr:MAG: hypothetical protein E8A12_18335 [Phenylobacterium sp.]